MADFDIVFYVSRIGIDRLVKDVLMQELSVYCPLGACFYYSYKSECGET